MIEGQKMIAKLMLGATICVAVHTNALADELPKELLLKCESDQTSFLDLGNDKKLDESKHTGTLRLKDGKIGDIRFNFLDGQDCQLSNGEIRCELRSTSYSPQFNSTTKRHSFVVIVRATGEYHYELKTESYPGKSTSGHSTGGTQIHRSGICRPASKPIF